MMVLKRSGFVWTPLSEDGLRDVSVLFTISQLRRRFLSTMLRDFWQIRELAGILGQHLSSWMD